MKSQWGSKVFLVPIWCKVEVCIVQWLSLEIELTTWVQSLDGACWFKIMEHNINYKTTTTAEIQRENIYSSSSNNYHIYNNDGLTTSGLKSPHRQESIQGEYSIGLTVLPLFLFRFSGVSYVIQKKIKSLFTLYRWFFRLWYEPNDLKWWHFFLCQGIHNLYISWYPRDLFNFFSLIISLKIAISMQSLLS